MGIFCILSPTNSESSDLRSLLLNEVYVRYLRNKNNCDIALGIKPPILNNFMDPLEVSKKHRVSKIGVFCPLFRLGMLGKSTSYSTGTQPLSSCFLAKSDDIFAFLAISWHFSTIFDYNYLDNVRILSVDSFELA